MKFMAFDRLAGFEEGVGLGDASDGVAMALGAFGEPERNGQNSGHGIVLFVKHQFLPHIHQPAALGIDGHTLIGQPFNLFTVGHIFGQPLGVGFGEAAADIECIDSRQVVLEQGAGDDEFRAGLDQGVEVFRVVKLEGRVPDDADAWWR